jgi:NitT/TauT family transport system permease protein
MTQVNRFLRHTILARNNLLLLAVTVLFILVWQFIIPIFVPEFLLPTPLSILSEYQVVAINWAYHTLVTVTEALTGFTIGAITAIVLAILITESTLLRRILYPYIVLAELTPKVALAPILYILLGFTNISRVLLVAIVLFFPIVINMSTGLTEVDQNLIYLLRSLGGGEATVFFKVRLPNSLPRLFDGFRISIVGSMIGAIIAEFVSSTQGLGFLIITSQYTFEVKLAFASLILLSFIGLALYALLELTSRLVMPWYRRG